MSDDFTNFVNDNWREFMPEPEWEPTISGVYGYEVPVTEMIWMGFCYVHRPAGFTTIVTEAEKYREWSDKVDVIDAAESFIIPEVMLCEECGKFENCRWTRSDAATVN